MFKNHNNLQGSQARVVLFRKSLMFKNHNNLQGSQTLLCYYGSSTYDTKEFSVLLDGIIEDMKDLGLQPPMPREVRAALEEWERQHGRKEEKTG